MISLNDSYYFAILMIRRVQMSRYYLSLLLSSKFELCYCILPFMVVYILSRFLSSLLIVNYLSTLKRVTPIENDTVNL